MRSIHECNSEGNAPDPTKEFGRYYTVPPGQIHVQQLPKGAKMTLGTRTGDGKILNTTLSTLPTSLRVSRSRTAHSAQFL